MGTSNAKVLPTNNRQQSALLSSPCLTLCAVSRWLLFVVSAAANQSLWLPSPSPYCAFSAHFNQSPARLMTCHESRIAFSFLKTNQTVVHLGNPAVCATVRDSYVIDIISHHRSARSASCTQPSLWKNAYSTFRFVPSSFVPHTGFPGVL